MAQDYIPNSDADFDAWQNTWYAYVLQHASSLNLPTP